MQHMGSPARPMATLLFLNPGDIGGGASAAMLKEYTSAWTPFNSQKDKTVVLVPASWKLAVHVFEAKWTVLLPLYAIL